MAGVEPGKRRDRPGTRCPDTATYTRGVDGLFHVRHPQSARHALLWHVRQPFGASAHGPRAPPRERPLRRSGGLQQPHARSRPRGAARPGGRGADHGGRHHRGVRRSRRRLPRGRADRAVRRPALPPRRRQPRRPGSLIESRGHPLDRPQPGHPARGAGRRQHRRGHRRLGRFRPRPQLHRDGQRREPRRPAGGGRHPRRGVGRGRDLRDHPQPAGVRGDRPAAAPRLPGRAARPPAGLDRAAARVRPLRRHPLRRPRRGAAIAAGGLRSDGGERPGPRAVAGRRGGSRQDPSAQRVPEVGERRSHQPLDRGAPHRGVLVAGARAPALRHRCGRGRTCASAARAGGGAAAAPRRAALAPGDPEQPRSGQHQGLDPAGPAQRRPHQPRLARPAGRAGALRRRGRRAGGGGRQRAARRDPAGVPGAAAHRRGAHPVAAHVALGDPSRRGREPGAGAARLPRERSAARRTRQPGDAHGERGPGEAGRRGAGVRARAGTGAVVDAERLLLRVARLAAAIASRHGRGARAAATGAGRAHRRGHLGAAAARAGGGQRAGPGEPSWSIRTCWCARRARPSPRTSSTASRASCSGRRCCA